MIRAEWLKIRGSKIYVLAVLTPLVMALFTLMIDVSMKYSDGGEHRWSSADFILFYFSMWNLLLFPFAVAFVANEIWGVEWAEAGFKLLYAQPVDRGTIYLVKSMFIFALVVVMQLVMGVAGYALAHLTSLPNEPSFATMTTRSFIFAVAAIPVVLLQSFLTAVKRGLLLPIAAVLVGFILNLICASPGNWWLNPFSYPAVGSELVAVPLLLSLTFGFVTVQIVAARSFFRTCDVS